MTNYISMIEAERMIKTCYRLNEPLFVLGDPGMGKTALMESVAKQLDIGFIDFRLTMRDPVDVGGMRIPDAKTGRMKHFVPEDLPTEGSDHDDAGIILFDEINSVGPMMQAMSYGIIQERRSGQKKLKAAWCPMASGNPMSSKASGQRISTATANRFNVQYVRQDVPGWLDQFGYANVHPYMVAFLKHRPELFSIMPGATAKNPDGTTALSLPADATSFPSARSWTKAAKAIDEDPVFRKKMFSGWVGELAAEEFEAFIRIMHAAISFDEIIANPKDARIPAQNQPAVYYAIAGMLARLCDRKNFDRVMIYVGRMIADYQVMIVRSATARDPSLKNTKGYGAWAVANQTVTL
jgi:ATPase family associated with various cellular activities (AAA)